MKRCTDGILRRPWAAATATMRTKNPIGSSQSKLNQRSAADPDTGGHAGRLRDRARPGSRIDDILPTVNCERKLRTELGERPDRVGDGGSGRDARSPTSDMSASVHSHGDAH